MGLARAGRFRAEGRKEGMFTRIQRTVAIRKVLISKICDFEDSTDLSSALRYSTSVSHLPKPPEAKRQENSSKGIHAGLPI